MWIGIKAAARLRNLHPLQHRQGLLCGVLLADGGMGLNGLHNLLANGVDRIKSQSGLLKHHGYGAAAVLLQGAALERQNVLPVDANLAADLCAALGIKA